MVERVGVADRKGSLQDREMSGWGEGGPECDGGAKTGKASPSRTPTVCQGPELGSVGPGETDGSGPFSNTTGHGTVD